MREIKFRVWDIEKKYFWHPTDTGHTDFSVFNDEDSSVQQFTGLKDKNGKEIYEGDILRVGTHGDWLDNDEYINNIEVKFEYKKFGECDGCGWIYIPENREIVGNIFENPDLLAT